MRLWALLLIISGLVLSCREERKLSDSQIEELQKELNFIYESNVFLLTQIHVRAQSNPSAAIYYKLGKSLDSTVLFYLDSTKWDFLSHDTSLLNKNLLELQKNYSQLVQSIEKKFTAQLFLTDDKPYVSLKDVSFFRTAETNQLNAYLTIQKVLFQHQKSLHIIRSCYADYTCGFNIITRLGRLVQVYNTSDSTKIFLHFQNSSSDLFKPLNKIHLFNEGGKEMKLFTKKTVADTIYIYTKKLSQGKYKILADYFEERINGYSDTTEIEFPFTIK